MVVHGTKDEEVGARAGMQGGMVPGNSVGVSYTCRRVRCTSRTAARSRSPDAAVVLFDVGTHFSRFLFFVCSCSSDT